MTLNDLEIENGVFVTFSRFYVCEAHLKNEFSPKSLEIDQDSLRVKLN